ncbi:MAG: 23S rRNA (adenine(1618)-N(6))-methyltransferase RlmF [Fulvivirga sp.]
MASKKSQEVKVRLHPRNRNRERYDLNALIISNPELKAFVKPNKYGDDSVDFSNPAAVKLLNKALLNHYYGIKHWEFPERNLCPPIPGRADYLHYIADLLGSSNFGNVPKGSKIIGYDIGVGANCIYPIIGVIEYDWNFIGSDIDAKSVKSAQNIVDSNPALKGKITCRLQENTKDFFYDIIGKEDKIDFSICNPPFHASAEEAQQGTARKVKNLTGKEIKNPALNFAGISNELICDGGEYKFVNNMIRESKKFSNNCFWFSSLVSKQSNLKSIYQSLDKFEAVEVKTIPTGTGNKSSRIVAWTFLTKEEQKAWRESRWRFQ